jgi:hypothetical protein
MDPSSGCNFGEDGKISAGWWEGWIQSYLRLIAGLHVVCEIELWHILTRQPHVVAGGDEHALNSHIPVVSLQRNHGGCVPLPLGGLQAAFLRNGQCGL